MNAVTRLRPVAETEACSSPAREALRAAHVAARAAHERLYAARKASATARAHASTLASELADYKRILDADADAAADALASSLKDGVTPSTNCGSSIAECDARRLDAERRKKVADKVVVKLAAEENEAEEALKAATRAVAIAARDVTIEAAMALLDEFEEINARAMTLRARLHRQWLYSPNVPMTTLSTPEKLQKLVFENASTDVVNVNMPAWREAQAAGATWRDFEDSLMRDPEAVLQFSEALR